MVARPTGMRRTRRGAALCAAIASAAVAGGCAAGVHGSAGQPRGIVLTASQVAALRSFGAGDTAFGLNVLSALCRGQPGTNALISPVSLAAGLGMAYLGARGATAAAMARVLHLPKTGRALIPGLRARRALLASLNRPGITFAESNRLWADPSLVTRRSFAAALRESYRADLTHVPLLSAPEQARAAINSAVAAETRGHIRSLLPPGSIAPRQIGWVLTNALYLKAEWQHQFDRAKTGPGPFRTGNGAVVRVPYMHGTGYPYARTASGWVATALRYRGGRLAMLALLPPPGGGGRAAAVEGCKVPSGTELRALLHGLRRPGEGHQIALPKVKLGSSESLKAVLTRLGMGLAFSGRANFSGTSPQAWRIGFVQHAATLSIDENGAVASAATAVGVQATALPIPLVFDRPYLLIIRDTLTGEPLMMAWVANPSKS
jgi:serine protease inhibitor